MPVTRDQNFPVEAAQLMQAFNRMAVGHDMRIVIQAAANFFSACLHSYARTNAMTAEKARSFAEDTMRRTLANFQENWDRAGKSKPGDVPVNEN